MNFLSFAVAQKKGGQKAAQFHSALSIDLT